MKPTSLIITDEKKKLILEEKKEQETKANANTASTHEDEATHRPDSGGSRLTLLGSQDLSAGVEEQSLMRSDEEVNLRSSYGFQDDLEMYVVSSPRVEDGEVLPLYRV